MSINICVSFVNNTRIRDVLIFKIKLYLYKIVSLFLTIYAKWIKNMDKTNCYRYNKIDKNKDNLWWLNL